MTPEPLKVVQTDFRDLWTRQRTREDSCVWCGSKRAQLQPIEVDETTPGGARYRRKAWRCVSRQGCRERRGLLEAGEAARSGR